MNKKIRNIIFAVVIVVVIGILIHLTSSQLLPFIKHMHDSIAY